VGDREPVDAGAQFGAKVRGFDNEPPERILKESTMERPITTGTILIKDGAVLPANLPLQRQPYLPGWGLVTGFDGCGLDRAIRKTGWTFFCLGGEIKASAFGRDREEMVRKAIARILVKVKPEGFNALEIKRVDAVGPKQFPVLRYVTVYAGRRHIQESLFLVSAEQSPANNGTGEDSGSRPARSERRWWSGLAYGRTTP
jgi:hypothetical protein